MLTRLTTFGLIIVRWIAALLWIALRRITGGLFVGCLIVCRIFCSGFSLLLILSIARWVVIRICVAGIIGLLFSCVRLILVPLFPVGLLLAALFSCRLILAFLPVRRLTSAALLFVFLLLIFVFSIFGLFAGLLFGLFLKLLILQLAVLLQSLLHLLFSCLFGDDQFEIAGTRHCAQRRLVVSSRHVIVNDVSGTHSQIFQLKFESACPLGNKSRSGSIVKVFRSSQFTIDVVVQLHVAKHKVRIFCLNQQRDNRIGGHI